MALTDLALSRSRLDKVSDDRFEVGLLKRLLLDPSSSVLLVRDGVVPVDDDSSAGLRLRTWRGERAAELIEALGGAAALADGGADPATSTVAVHLGRFPAGDPRGPGALIGLLLPDAAEPGQSEATPGAPIDETVDAAMAGVTGGLREVGALLSDTDAGAVTEAVALHHWHRSHPRCPRCGAATLVAAAGHERICLQDASSHHPRHDPAVIMTVTDPAGRLLLGRQGRWPVGRFSAFAGFVEPGESLEQAVARELVEEAGVRTRTALYLGSQPWPFPASLMLAFHVETDDTEAVPDGREIVEARWFDRTDLIRAVVSGEVTVPPSVSVARRLIERWLGEPLSDTGTWR